jgi:galactokinase
MISAVDARVRTSFVRAVGGSPSLVSRAPGRVNLIGEHTDYNDGFVFPCAIGFETRVAARARNDGIYRLVAADFGDAADAFDARGEITPSTDHPWSNYIRGVVAEMRRAGYATPGADFAVAGDVPQGAGLSSSAALEVATALAIAALDGRKDADRTALARVCQRAENDFVGCKCGIMDQLVSARGVEGAALLIDCRSLDCRPVTAPEEAAILIVHSGVIHGHVEGKYNERRRQCEDAAATLGVAKLRDADEAMLARYERLLDPVTFRRARHVITENRRTVEAAEAFALGDLAKLGRLMRESHLSMREDFEITTPEVDRLAALLNASIGMRGGARMTGGGFGGAVVAVAPAANVASVAREVSLAYRRPDGKPTEIIVQRPAPGASCA